MWIVDIQPNGAEEILHTHIVCVHAIDEILIPPTDHNLEGKHRKINSFNDYSPEEQHLKLQYVTLCARNIKDSKRAGKRTKHDQSGKSKKKKRNSFLKVRAARLDFTQTQARLHCIVLTIRLVKRFFCD